MPHIRSATSEQTWAAEWTANRASTEQDAVTQGHRCGNCGNNPYMRSKIRCANDPGGV